MDETLIQARERELARTGRYYQHICWMVIPLLCMSCFLYGLRPLLLCGAAVAVAGPIGFVGLVVPHVVRRLVTEDIRLALPLAAPVGALALVLADIAARTLVAPQELATGAMTALVGAPLFIFIAARFFK